MGDRFFEDYIISEEEIIDLIISFREGNPDASEEEVKRFLKWYGETITSYSILNLFDAGEISLKWSEERQNWLVKAREKKDDEEEFKFIRISE